MPTHFLHDDTPIVQFDSRLEVSPFALFRRLREGGSVLLVDVRRGPGSRSLLGAESWTGPDWEPPEGLEVVLFDDDGSQAVALAAKLQGAGHERVRALFGGLDLYEFALDPQVVGSETFLVRDRAEARRPTLPTRPPRR